MDATPPDITRHIFFASMLAFGWVFLSLCIGAMLVEANYNNCYPKPQKVATHVASDVVHTALGVFILTDVNQWGAEFFCKPN